MNYVRRSLVARGRQKGMTLLAVSAMATILASAGFAAYYAASTRTQFAMQSGQDQTLAQADAIIQAFAAANARLPCPADNRGGQQNCGLQKGYFPADVSAVYGPGALAGDLDGLRYFTTSRLASRTDVFPTENNLNRTANGYDLCRMLAETQNGRGGVDGGLPADEVSGGVEIYGLAAPGASGFTGDNASADAAMESPNRARSAGYTERVKKGRVRELARSESCAALLNSLNVLNMAHSWNKGMPDTRESAADNFLWLTVWPQVNTMLIWQEAAVLKFWTQYKERENFVEALQLLAEKDWSFCSLGQFLACDAAALQEAAKISAIAASAHAVYEVGIFEERVIQAAAALVDAGVRLAQYRAVDLWQDQDDVLSKTDKRGAQLQVGSAP